MTHIFGDPIQIRDRNVITIPKDVRKILNVSIGDWVGFDIFDNDKICVHKIIPHRMKNKGGGDVVKKLGSSQS